MQLGERTTGLSGERLVGQNRKRATRHSVNGPNGLLVRCLVALLPSRAMGVLHICHFEKRNAKCVPSAPDGCELRKWVGEGRVTAPVILVQL